MVFSGESGGWHCPISTATTSIDTGSSCACSGGQSRVCLVWQLVSAKQRHFRSATPNQTTVSCCRHCDGEVVKYAANAHVVVITHLLSLSKSSNTSQSV